MSTVWCPIDGEIDGEQCSAYHCAGMVCGKLEKENQRMRELYAAVIQIQDEFDVRPHTGKEGGYIACKWGYNPRHTIIADGIGSDAVEAIINLARELKEQ